MATRTKTVSPTDAAKTAQDFVSSVVGTERLRVDAICVPEDGGWSVEIAAFVSDPSLSVDKAGVKSEVFDEFAYVVTLDAEGAVRSMAKR